MKTFLFVVLCAVPGFAAQLTRGPYLQLADATGITVVFRTDLPSSATVRFGPAGAALDGAVDDVVPTTNHVVRLSNLAPFTEYAYEVVVDGVPVAGGESLRFRTYPSPGTAAPFRLFAWGDSGLGNAAQLNAAARMSDSAADATLSLILGDIIYPAGQAELYDDRYFAPYAPLLRRMVVWPTIGNHDIGVDPLGGPYLDAFELPKNNPAGTELYYSFDYGDAHFVCLDTHVSGHAPGSAQLAWAQADLVASNAKWKFVFFHVPPYSGGTHLDDAVVRAGIVPLVEAAGVDLVFAGHSHVYERTYLLQREAIVQADRANYLKASPDAGTLYVVSGTGGQLGGLQNPAHPLMAFQAAGTSGVSVLDVNGDTAHGYFLQSDGTMIDAFSLSKGADVTGPRINGARPSVTGSIQVFFDEPVVNATTDATWDLPPGFTVREASRNQGVILDGPADFVGPIVIRALNLKDRLGNVTPVSEWRHRVDAVVDTLGGGPFRFVVAAPPAGWTKPEFDDSTWRIGNVMIGNEVTEPATRIALGDAPAAYVREHFTIDRPFSTIRGLSLNLIYRDAFVAYLNGVEVARQNVPQGQGAQTFATTSMGTTLSTNVPLALAPESALRQGDNVLAVEVRRVGTTTPLVLTVNVNLEVQPISPAVQPGKLDGGGCGCRAVDVGMLWLALGLMARRPVRAASRTRAS